MSEQMTEAGVVEALMGAAAEDGFERSDITAQKEVQAEVADEQAAITPPEDGAAEGTTEETDSFLKHLNPDELPEDLIPYYKSMQGDFTRKSQELAESRRQYEALEQYGGVDVALQGLDWISSLQDPENARTLHRELTAALEAEGYSAEDASAEAARQVETAQTEELEGFDDEPYNALKSEVDQLKANLRQREEIELQERISARMDRQEAEIRSAHPEYEDEDVEALYALAYSTGADLGEADKIYQGIEANILGRYIEKKSSPAPVVGSIPSGADADQTPATPKDLYDKDLEASVTRFVAERMAAES